MFTRNLLIKNLIFIICTSFIYVFYPDVIWGEDTQIKWHRHETKYTIIQYSSNKDVKKLDRSIDFSPGEFSLKGLFIVGDTKDPMGSITQKIDVLFEKVQQILDMRKRIKKVMINVYPDEKRFHEAYYHLTWTECHVRSWYLYENNTIYINVDDVHEGILAHEMAHAIIDNYLDVRPPRATAEILAVYVDEHLFD
jgi:hypothetical protein